MDTRPLSGRLVAMDSNETTTTTCTCRRCLIHDDPGGCLENEALPVAVYGTLRPGYGNDRLWQGRAECHHDGEATIEGYRLVGRGFPYAIPAEHERIVVGLVQPEPDEYERVLAMMDRLEGVPRHYRRVLEVATTPEGIRACWLYVPAEPRWHEDNEPVPGNDWANVAGWRWGDDD